jgi:hypothetical protein
MKHVWYQKCLDFALSRCFLAFLLRSESRISSVAGNGRSPSRPTRMNGLEASKHACMHSRPPRANQTDTHAFYPSLVDRFVDRRCASRRASPPADASLLGSRRATIRRSRALSRFDPNNNKIKPRAAKRCQGHAQMHRVRAFHNLIIAIVGLEGLLKGPNGLRCRGGRQNPKKEKFWATRQPGSKAHGHIDVEKNVHSRVRTSAGKAQCLSRAPPLWARMSARWTRSNHAIA